MPCESCKKTIELDDSFGMAHFFLGATYTEQGRYREALGELETAVRLSGRNPDILAALGYLHGVSGDRERARSVLNELTEVAATRYVSPAKIAQVHVGVGEHMEALDLLEKAYVEADSRSGLARRPSGVRWHSRREAILNALDANRSRSLEWFVMKVVLTALILLAQPMVAVAQQPATQIVGSVVDPAGSPLEGVVVSVIGEVDIRTAVTDRNGRFRFDEISPSSYKMSAKEERGRASVCRICSMVCGDSISRSSARGNWM